MSCIILSGFPNTWLKEMYDEVEPNKWESTFSPEGGKNGMFFGCPAWYAS